jgi:hypothetical protein
MQATEFAGPRSCVSGTTIARLMVIMLTHRFLAPVLAACASFATFAGCSVDAGVDGPIADASLRVVNNSDFVIDQIYLTEVGSSTWGPNLLRGDALFPDEELLLGVGCDTYDALVVDEDGVDCEINNVDLCLNDSTWVIRNNTCSVFGVSQ